MTSPGRPRGRTLPVHPGSTHTETILTRYVLHQPFNVLPFQLSRGLRLFQKNIFQILPKPLLTSGSHPPTPILHLLTAIIWFISSSHGEVLTGTGSMVCATNTFQVRCQMLHIRRLIKLPWKGVTEDNVQSAEPDPLRCGRKEACNQVIAQKCSMCF